jgi:CRP/FNR family transcriptional regulator, cyclic AMP receptor protein
LREASVDQILRSFHYFGRGENADMVKHSKDALRTIAYFKSLGDAAFAELAQQCALREYAAQELIIGHNDETFDVLFLLAGQARVSIYSADGQRVGFRDIAAGTIFGELSAIDGHPRSASVEAVETCVAAVMRRPQFLAAVANHPEFTMAVAKHLTGQVRVLTQRVFEFSTMAVRQRLAEAAAKGKDQALLSPAPTHAEFASRISTHREAVTREFAWLETQGFIEKDGRALKVPDIEKLRGLVGTLEV